jgi:protein gp37
MDWFHPESGNRLHENQPRLQALLCGAHVLEGFGNINLKGIHWAIVGGESGPQARPMDKEWVVEIKDQCLSATVPFFFKQWGGTNKKKAGRLLDNRTWDEVPVAV